MMRVCGPRGDYNVMEPEDAKHELGFLLAEGPAFVQVSFWNIEIVHLDHEEISTYASCTVSREVFPKLLLCVHFVLAHGDQNRNQMGLLQRGPQYNRFFYKIFN